MASYLENVRAQWSTKLATIRYALTPANTAIAQTTGTITRETGSFITDGWADTMTGTIADSGSNNGATFTVVTAAALTLTVSETLTAQTKAQTISCVLTSYPYRNTVKAVYQTFPATGSVPSYPWIVFHFGEGKLESTNSAWSVYDLRIPFSIFCGITADTSTAATSNLITAQDSLLHDVMRVIAVLYTLNVNSSPRWNVQNDPPVTFSPIFPGEENTGWFVVRGWMHLRNLDGSFDD